jgi:hypothetical protein
MPGKVYVQSTSVLATIQTSSAKIPSDGLEESWSYHTVDWMSFDFTFLCNRHYFFKLFLEENLARVQNKSVSSQLITGSRQGFRVERTCQAARAVRDRRAD